MSSMTRPAVPKRCSPVVVHGRVAEGAGLVGAVELQHLGAGDVLEGGRPLEGHGLAAGEHRAQRAEVAGPLGVGVQHHDELRAHAAQHGDPLALDQVERLVGVEVVHHHRGAAEDARGEVAGPEPEAERGRDGAEEDLVVAEVAGQRGQPVEVEPPVLGVHDALGQAGGARGGVQQEQGVGVRVGEGSLDLRPGSPFGHPAVDDRAVDVDQHDAVDGRAERGEVGHQLPGGTAAVLGDGDEDAGPGEREQMGDLAVAGPMADAHHHQPGPLDADERGVHAGAVGHEDGDPFTVGGVAGHQRPGEAVGRRVVLRPGEPGRPAHEGERVGSLGGPAAHEGAHGLVTPPPVGAVLGRLGGVGSDLHGGPPRTLSLQR